MRLYLVFLAVLTTLLLISPSVPAVEFGPNSANITNPYLPLKVGAWSYRQGSGPTWVNRIFYIHAIGTEVVSGAQINQQVFNDVKAIKVNVAVTDDGGSYQHEFMTMSFAQDKDGNVWLLKLHAHMSGVTGLLGGPYFQSMFMPAVPAEGLSAGIKMPEDQDNYCSIVEVGINSLATNYGTYDDCFKIHCFDEDPQDIEVEYFCRGFGIVRSTTVASPTDVMDLKESGTATDKRAVVIPLTD
jgi:subtilisin family serine protease